MNRIWTSGRSALKKQRERKEEGGKFVMKVKVINVLCSVFTLLAMVYAAAPCLGRYCEPEVPEELREK